ncbi:MAG: hypothetical protein FP816_15700 [Desulfobacteraceae bacterium]|nr:hypothetical protein [Desulfobacteraceae bacterium]MBU3948964.1 hypothetical protein [Pseudomonadota bacterium]MBU4010655.1 hypothetical protein [Pseudomonadota bacterium]
MGIDFINDVFNDISPNLFNEERCEDYFIRKIHKSPACPHCGAEYGQLPERFWSNQQCFCMVCKEKFFAITDTIFSHNKVPFSAIFLCCLLFKLGWKDVEIAKAIKANASTVRRWREKIAEQLLVNR